MAGDPPRDEITFQTEFNRQALVSMGKRLTELEHQMVGLESETQDLKHYSARSLETATRLQGVVRGLVDRRKQKDSQEELD